MTRKDYRMIAAALRANWELIAGVDQVRDAIHVDYCRSVADALAQDNPRFDREQFMKAAGASDAIANLTRRAA